MQLLIWLTETDDLDEIDPLSLSAFSARTSPRWQAFKGKVYLLQGFFETRAGKGQEPVVSF